MSAIDDYKVKRADARRAEIVQLAAAALQGLTAGVILSANGKLTEPTASYTNIAVNLAVATQRCIDEREGDSF
jgi:hypothetical protein